MIKNFKKLEVRYRDDVVGYLIELGREKFAFQYDNMWIEKGFSISPLFLPLSDKVYVSESPYFQGLYGVFSDSLPDGWGELLLNKMLNHEGYNPSKVSPLTKLSLINATGLGGLTYFPCQCEDNSESHFDLDKIALKVEKILVEEGIVSDYDEVYKLGGSSGGARPKVHIKLNDESFIVKFPSSFDPKNIGEKEYKANFVARECGINVPDFLLLPSKICSGYFATKRFDRENNKRVHTISLSSILETTHRIPNLDYKHLFQVINAICGEKNKNRNEAFLRMCFNVLYKNKDDHGKNFSFIYNEEINGYELSPAYDLTPVPSKSEHEMTVNGKGNPTEQDILDLANMMNLKMDYCKSALKKVKDVINANKNKGAE